MASWITKGKRSAELRPCVAEWIAYLHSPQRSWPRLYATHLGSLAKASFYEESGFSRSCNVVARSVATSPPNAKHCSRRALSQHATFWFSQHPHRVPPSLLAPDAALDVENVKIRLWCIRSWAACECGRRGLAESRRFCRSTKVDKDDSTIQVVRGCT